MGKFFVAQGLVTLQKIIRPGPNSNWSESLCLSWIPASLKKLQSKLKVLWAGQHFPHYKSMGNFCRSRASNSVENNQTWPKFELVRALMPVLDICKFEQVVIKTQGSMTRTTFSPLLFMGPFCCHGNHSF